jgi:hypothetical protein
VAERFVLSIKSVCLDKLVPLGERHLRLADKDVRLPRRFSWLLPAETAVATIFSAAPCSEGYQRLADCGTTIEH